MATRDLQNYFGIDTRSGEINNYLAANAEAGILPKLSVKKITYQIEDFFQTNPLPWAVHDFLVKPRYEYPAVIGEDSIYDAGGDTVTLALAADWGTDTNQAAYIGARMLQKNPHYTIHLGDVYYAGTEKELMNNYGKGNGDWGLWPRGSRGSFALAGNHEMFSGGGAYFNMITDPQRQFGQIDSTNRKYSGQKAPVFCIRTKYWCILGLDTGYDSLLPGVHLPPDNTAMQLPDAVMTWLTDVVKIKEEKRGILVLTHHQYMSAFEGEPDFAGPAKQLQDLIPGKEIIWIWGHEHRFAMYGKYQQSNAHIAAYGRCIGNGGMPDEHLKERRVIDAKAKQCNLVLFDERVAANVIINDGDEDHDLPPWTEDIGFNGYALLQLNFEQVLISYYESYGTDPKGNDGKDEIAVAEAWEVDTSNGTIRTINVVDQTRASNNKLSYFGEPNARRAGKLGV